MRSRASGRSKCCWSEKPPVATAATSTGERSRMPPATPPLYATSCCGAVEEAPFVPHHAEEGFVLCWECHGYLVGPVGRRLCRCQDLGPVSPAQSEKLS